MSALRRGFGDLGVRVASALVLVGIGGTALLFGGAVWFCLLTIVAALMMWELAPLCDPQLPATPRRGIALATLAAGLAGWLLHNAQRTPLSEAAENPLLPALLIAVPSLAGLMWLRRGRGLFVAYALIVNIGAVFLYALRLDDGWLPVLLLIAIVATSDTAGYFVGRTLGGPRFWPSISPNKTWSGTVGGWVFCALFGLIFLPQTGLPVWLAPFVAFVLCLAAQFGDIAESAIKRRVAIKDASNLIPGHGGLMDRFDGLVAAAALGGALTVVAGV